MKLCTSAGAFSPCRSMIRLKGLDRLKDRLGAVRDLLVGRDAGGELRLALGVVFRQLPGFLGVERHALVQFVPHRPHVFRP
jgi:hypothetical protein